MKVYESSHRERLEVLWYGRIFYTAIILGFGAILGANC